MASPGGLCAPPPALPAVHLCPPARLLNVSFCHHAVPGPWPGGPCTGLGCQLGPMSGLTPPLPPGTILGSGETRRALPGCLQMRAGAGWGLSWEGSWAHRGRVSAFPGHCSSGPRAYGQEAKSGSHSPSGQLVLTPSLLLEAQWIWGDPRQSHRALDQLQF